MTIGQLIKYSMRNIFLEKSYTKCGRETIPRPFTKTSKLSITLNQKSKGWVAYRFSYAIRHNDASKTTPTPSLMHYSHSFDKVNGSLKPVLNILILWNLTVGCGDEVIKEAAGII